MQEMFKSENVQQKVYEAAIRRKYIAVECETKETKVKYIQSKIEMASR